METYAIAPFFLQNCISVVLALIISPLLKIRWLAAILSCAGAVASGFFWKDIGIGWLDTWNIYFYETFGEGRLRKGPLTDHEMIGLILLVLLPLALAYFTAVALIIKRPD